MDWVRQSWPCVCWIWVGDGSAGLSIADCVGHDDDRNDHNMAVDGPEGSLRSLEAELSWSRRIRRSARPGEPRVVIGSAHVLSLVKESKSK